MTEPSDSEKTKSHQWADLGKRMKLLWVASFLVAFLVGVGMGIYLTFS